MNCQVVHFTKDFLLSEEHVAAVALKLLLEGSSVVDQLKLEAEGGPQGASFTDSEIQIGP